MENALLKRVSEELESKAIARAKQTRRFIASHRADIQTMLERGHHIKVIWQVLQQKEEIHCSYNYFWKLIREAFPSDKKMKLSAVKSQAINKPIAKPANTDSTPQNKAEGFVFNPNPNPKELY